MKISNENRKYIFSSKQHFRFWLPLTVVSSSVSILVACVANGNICEQDLLEDPAVIDAIDEETEFNALVVRGYILSIEH